MNETGIQKLIIPPIPRKEPEKKEETKPDSKENKGPPPIHKPLRPKSPRDVTAITVNGVSVERESLPQIELPNESMEIKDLVPLNSISNKEVQQFIEDQEEQLVIRNNIEIESTDVTTPIDIIKPSEILSPTDAKTIENFGQPTPENIKPMPQKGIPVKNSIPSSKNNINLSKKPIKPTRPPLSPRTADQLKKLGYLTNYTRLKINWPEYKFPDIPDDASTEYVIRAYEHCINKIQVDMSVSQYKAGLIIIFLIIEVVSVKLLGLDGGGYTASQIKAMNRYERLLIELGEKRLVAVGKAWPVEIRITFIALINFGIFVLTKFLTGLLGPELTGMVTPLLTSLFSGSSVSANTVINGIPVPEVPERGTNISNLVGTVAQMASSALGGNTSQPNETSTQNNNFYRRPTYRQ
jgi:hypothetical protein